MKIADYASSQYTGFFGHLFSGAYELKNDLKSGSGKSFENISVILEPENSWIVSQQTLHPMAEAQKPLEPETLRAQSRTSLKRINP